MYAKINKNLLPHVRLVGDTTRFKHLRQYVYNYEADTASGVTGTADSHTGSKIQCKVRRKKEQCQLEIFKKDT